MSQVAQQGVDMTVQHWGWKMATAVVAALIPGSWSEAAAMAAFFYSMLLISEWFWKRFWRPLFERRGWLKRTKRRASDKEAE